MKTVEFFMLITNRDFLIGKYAIKSYEKLIEPLTNKFSWTLRIYANGLSKENLEKLAIMQKDYPYIKIYDNRLIYEEGKYAPGETIYSDDGGFVVSEGPYEHCDIIWSRECKNFTTDYFCTVDADLEILDAQIIVDALYLLEKYNKLACLSSDKTDTLFDCYESYSDRICTYYERYNTWLCFYKKTVQICETSHFCFEENIDNMDLVYDSAARFQRDLRQKFGFYCYAMTRHHDKYNNMFIHYGQFSKNRSIDTELKTAIYRYINLRAKVGFKFLHRAINIYIKCFFHIANKILYTNTHKERTIHNNTPTSLDISN